MHQNDDATRPNESETIEAVRSPGTVDSSPLEGLVVVDTTTFLAGPFGGLILADLGADVIKVEPPGQDPLRRMKSAWHPTSPMAANVNRNKRSITIDLKDSKGTELFYELIRSADVVLFNMRPSAALDLGVDDATLSSLNPRLIRAWLSGYGLSGPRSNEPAFDSTVQAYTGLIATQSASGDPAPMRTYIADKVSGMFMVQSVLAALVKRSFTGAGERIDLSMLDSGAYFGFPDIFEDYTFLDQGPGESGPEAAAIVVPTADGLIVLAPASGRQLKATLDVVGHPEWKATLLKIVNRSTLMATLTELLQPVLGTETTAVWVDRFSAADVPVAPVLGLPEHLADPQVVENEIYQVYQHPQFGPVRAVRYPARYASSPSVSPMPFPEANENRSEILERWTV
jgi:crotonobetainyl-CoA:carnitine CoA-transferase CaiB-like acyl-CoA transferase